MDRSDFDTVLDEAGPQRLMLVLRARLVNSERLHKELRRMSRSGKWVVLWNKKSGEGKIVVRIARASQR